ncbi:MAG: inositol monophosphatase [Leptolyngbya sp. SIO4C1]|nr:inositol monophosphatase [Leptolyngbya sp. SIO4C1]
MTLNWQHILDTAEAATARVGAQLLQDFGSATAETKADGSLVTQSDQWADAELRRLLQKEFADHGVLSEEVEHVLPDTDWCWIIDPIDGTTNFTRGIPLWGISLALLYQGTPVFGHIYLPPLDQRFHGYWLEPAGWAGPSGAFCDHQPIRTSTAEPSGTQFFSLCARSTAVLQRPFPCKIRMLGVATYNLLTVAAGISVGAVEATPKIWDIAAAWVIAKAAGAAWIPLDQPSVFPLKSGKDYSQTAFPTLLISRAALVAQFRPLVEPVGRR